MYILQGIRSCTFEELDTQAHDIELVIKTNASENMSIEELKDDTIKAKTLSIRMERVWHQISLQLFTKLNTLLCSKNRKKKLSSIKQEGIKVIHKLEFDLFKWSIIENVQTINKVKPMDTFELFNTNKVWKVVMLLKTWA